MKIRLRRNVHVRSVASVAGTIHDLPEKEAMSYVPTYADVIEEEDPSPPQPEPTEELSSFPPPDEAEDETAAVERGEVSRPRRGRKRKVK